MSHIKSIKALELLDSRGHPTVAVQLFLEDGSEGFSKIPSGASTGSREALELRDGDKSRYLGKGVLKAIANINQTIAPALIGMEAKDQKAIDQAMLKLDGTENKSKLGANAILGVSLSVARASAKSQGIPLYRHIEALYGKKTSVRFPVPIMNVINGGEHADNALNIQEFMIQPHGFDSFPRALQAASEIFHTLKGLLHDKGLATSVGDEGGFAPDIASTKVALDLLVEAIKKAGYKPKEQVSIAIDLAASEFFKNGQYKPESDQPEKDAQGVADYIEDLCNNYPISTIEDGLDEGDWEGWEMLTKQIGSKVQLIGDDIFVTNPKIFKEGIQRKIANSILIKLNQIGTLSETLDCIAMAQDAGYKTVISHRSGETSDDFIADLAVGTGAGQIKTGSLSRSDRIEKYNRLLYIATELTAPYAQ